MILPFLGNSSVIMLFVSCLGKSAIFYIIISSCLQFEIRQDGLKAPSASLKFKQPTS